MTVVEIKQWKRLRQMHVSKLEKHPRHSVTLWEKSIFQSHKESINNQNTSISQLKSQHRRLFQTFPELLLSLKTGRVPAVGTENVSDRVPGVRGAQHPKIHNTHLVLLLGNDHFVKRYDHKTQIQKKKKDCVCPSWALSHVEARDVISGEGLLSMGDEGGQVSLSRWPMS